MNLSNEATAEKNNSKTADRRLIDTGRMKKKSYKKGSDVARAGNDLELLCSAWFVTVSLLRRQTFSPCLAERQGREDWTKREAGGGLRRAQSAKSDLFTRQISTACDQPCHITRPAVGVGWSEKAFV